MWLFKLFMGNVVFGCLLTDWVDCGYSWLSMFACVDVFVDGVSCLGLFIIADVWWLFVYYGGLDCFCFGGLCLVRLGLCYGLFRCEFGCLVFDFVGAITWLVVNVSCVNSVVDLWFLLLKCLFDFLICFVCWVAVLVNLLCCFDCFWVVVFGLVVYFVCLICCWVLLNYVGLVCFIVCDLLTCDTCASRWLLYLRLEVWGWYKTQIWCFGCLYWFGGFGGLAV